MMWNSKAIVFDLDDTLFLEANYFERIFSNFCLIYEWPKHAYESIINNFSIVRREHKDIFSYFLNQNQFYWQTGNANSDLNFFRILRDNLFSLYIEIDTKLIPIYGVKEWLNYAESNAIKVGVLTNGVIKAQYNKWKNLNIPHKENITFIAARECIKEKPFYEPFEYISKTMGVKLNKITFVGDRFENDLEYPLSIGSTGILISNQKIENNSMFYRADDIYSAYLFFKNINF